MSTYICVKLADEAGEITVFKVFREEISGELVRIPDNEAVASLAP